MDSSVVMRKGYLKKLAASQLIIDPLGMLHVVGHPVVPEGFVCFENNIILSEHD